MHTFCTLFNSRYLSRGIEMYLSLERVSRDFILYVFAFDQITYDVLKAKNYPKLRVISLEEFEDDQLILAKRNRNDREYCWTCASSTIHYVLNRDTSISSCTYLDADMIFYSDPTALLDTYQSGDHSAIITPHRYAPRYDESHLSGIYCVQWVTIFNNPQGLEVIKWWRQSCLDWCYDRYEDGKFGDQKYLDDWLTRFKGVVSLGHPGAGLAPWNLIRYSYTDQGDSVKINESHGASEVDLIFFHYHGFIFSDPANFVCSSKKYWIPKSIKEKFYTPYAQLLYQREKELSQHHSSYSMLGLASYRDLMKKKWLKGHIAFIRCNVLYPLIHLF